MAEKHPFAIQPNIVSRLGNYIVDILGGGGAADHYSACHRRHYEKNFPGMTEKK